MQNGLSATARRSRSIIAVKGGPGSGKTWLAMHLLGVNARAKRQVSYATNSTSLVAALKKKARKELTSLPVDGLVTSARTYHREEDWRDPLDVLVVDEANRLTEYTITGGHNNSRERQEYLEEHGITALFELHKSSKTLVLLIDEGQATTPRDFCTLTDIKEIADEVGASFSEFELTEQHRSGGSEAYERWVNDLVAGCSTPWTDDDHYNLRLANNPSELQELVVDSSNGNTGRLLAGFCWDWQKWPPSPESIDDIPYDIVIDDWKARWNLRNSIDGFPKDSDWASDEKGAVQVGSVFTAQGFEFPRCGVIIGPDFRWDPGQSEWVVDVSQSRYSMLRSAYKRRPEVENLIRNHYRVLLTRAMEETIVYSTDPATQTKLAELINP